MVTMVVLVVSSVKERLPRSVLALCLTRLTLHQAKVVIGDPSYFRDKVKTVGKVVRAICLLDHPIPNTKNSLSSQIIIPGNQADRKNGEKEA